MSREEVIAGETSNSDVSQETSRWYDRYYAKKGALRNSLLRNPEVMFQSLAAEMSITQALASIDVDAGTAQVLDVGCGDGSSLIHFLKLGFVPTQLSGIDILKTRVEEARLKLPGSQLTVGDAANVPYPDETFDVVFESTMFVQLTDETLARRIAAEMLRVTKVGGHLLLSDWRYSKPGNEEYVGLSTKRIGRLFHDGAATDIVGFHAGALVPPIGRYLSKRAGSLYFMLRRALPLLVGQRVAVISKRPLQKAA